MTDLVHSYPVPAEKQNGQLTSRKPATCQAMLPSIWYRGEGPSYCSFYARFVAPDGALFCRRHAQKVADCIPLEQKAARQIDLCRYALEQIATGTSGGGAWTDLAVIRQIAKETLLELDPHLASPNEGKAE